MSRLAPLLLLALAAAPAAAQSPAPRSANGLTAAERQLIGTWEGPYQSDQAPPGGLRLVIARDSAWKVSMEVISDESIPSGEITEFKVEGTTLSWVQEVMGMACRAQASLVDGTLKGDSSCDQGGGVTITASWVLLKK